MKKVFISQPMRGLSDEEILAARRDAICKIRDKIGDSFTVIDSALTDCSRGPIWCLGRSICLMCTADIAYFLEGWRSARGCRIEHEVAEQYGIDVIEA